MFVIVGVLILLSVEIYYFQNFRERLYDANHLMIGMFVSLFAFMSPFFLIAFEGIPARMWESFKNNLRATIED